MNTERDAAAGAATRADAKPASIVGLVHAGIQVADIDRSIAFYESLGLTLERRGLKDQPYLQRLVGYPGVTLDIAVMSIPGTDTFFEILQYHGTDGVPIDPATANPGTGHVCFLVDDLDAHYESLLARGVEFLSPPQTAEPGPISGRRVIYMKDPDGIRVEMLQLPAE